MNLFYLLVNSYEVMNYVVMNNNKVVDAENSNIVLDHKIKTRDQWVARIMFIHERRDERVHVLKKELVTCNNQAGVLIAKSLTIVNEIHSE